MALNDNAQEIVLAVEDTDPLGHYLIPMPTSEHFVLTDDGEAVGVAALCGAECPGSPPKRSGPDGRCLDCDALRVVDNLPDQHVMEG